MSPLLSIILPTYNREKYLKIAIDSILNQSFSNFELIVVDDYSSDASCDIVGRINDKRLKYYRQEYNRGEYWCTNYAASIAKGKYLTWIHSDDIMAADSLKIRIAQLEANPNLDFVHGDIEKIDENGTKIADIPASDLNSEKLLEEYLKMPEEREVKYLVHHLSIMMRTDFFRKTGGFDDKLPFAGDIDWLIRAIKMGNFKVIHNIMYYYRYHSQSRRVTDIENGVNKDEVNLKIINKYKGIYGFNK